MDIYADRIIAAWEMTSPAIAVARRGRDASVLENFEYLYVRASGYVARHPQGMYPVHVPRAALHDRWAEVDALKAAAES